MNPTHRGSQDRLDSIPESVWVRHGGRTYKLSVFCPDTSLYSTTVIMRAMYGRAGEEAAARRIVMPDGRVVTMTGYGLSSSDPLYCAELQEDPLPQCRCGYRHSSDDDVAETCADTVAQGAAVDTEDVYSTDVDPLS